MIDKLISLATELDRKGLTKEADYLDRIILKLADGPETLMVDEVLADLLVKYMDTWSGDEQKALQFAGGHQVTQEEGEGVQGKSIGSGDTPGEFVMNLAYPSMIAIAEVLNDLGFDFQRGQVGSKSLDFGINEMLKLGLPLTWRRVQPHEPKLSEAGWMHIRSTADKFKADAMSRLPQDAMREIQKHNAREESVQFTTEDAHTELRQRGLSL